MYNTGAQNVFEKIPTLNVNAGPGYVDRLIISDKENWIKRLKEEYIALIKYVEINKADDNDWFKIEMKD